MPHRIRYLDRILEYIMGHDAVWQTTADDIAQHYIDHHYDEVMASMQEFQRRHGGRVIEGAGHEL